MLATFALHAALVALALHAAPLGAQTVAGQALDRATGGPVVNTAVALRDAADTVIARGRTDSLGLFHLATAGAGRYSVMFAFGARRGAASSPFTVADTAAFHQAQFVLDLPTDTIYFEHEVDRPAAPDNLVAPTYPSLLQQQGVSGGLIAEFVVDSLGRPDVESFVALQATHPEFVAAVRTALRRMRFLPAERGGRKVAQLVHQAFDFTTAR